MASRRSRSRWPSRSTSSVTANSASAVDTAGSSPGGLTALFASRGSRARRVTAPGSLVTEAIRFSGLDRWTQAWWPQGIAAGQFAGAPLLIVSWFSKRSGRGARITVLDLTALRYRHVTLAESDGTTPVDVHAGGLVWSGDRLLVAATFGGIREFRLSGIRRSSAGRFVLPQTAHLLPAERFRYSFLGSSGDGVVAGEFARDSTGRLARLELSDAAVTATDIHTPGISEMQGAVVVGGMWFISSSRGDRVNGDLWIGERGRFAKHLGALPPGPEDLAWDGATGRLWGVTEHPGQRWIYAVAPPTDAKAASG